MRLVSLDLIPKEIIDTPKEDLVEVYMVCKKMERICDLKNGIGLSAAQVGIPWRLFILKVENGYEYFIDCEYLPEDQHGKVDSLEGWLSLDVGKR